ncbi:Pro-Pol polyprotein [Forsythia ovata]|uniref:Pro-Pol polyprotein n=1 Tax=Forsythia ovata TaxID=205694 RepID=A0ABD1Q8X4_9LAMI
MFGFSTKSLLDSVYHRVLDPRHNENRPVPSLRSPISSYAPLSPKPCINFPGLAPSRRARKSVSERQVELEERLMQNSLTRGKGVKAIKIAKELTGTSSFLVSDVSLHKPRFERSPERGIGHIVCQSVSRPHVKLREMPISRVSLSLGVSEAPDIDFDG